MSGKMPAMLNGSDQFDDPGGEASNVDRAFAALHSALGGGEYIQAIKARKELHFPGLLSGQLDGFPNIADMEQALEQGAFAPEDLRVSAKRKVINLTELRFVTRGRLEPQMLANAALMGNTIVFNRLHLRIPKAHRLAKHLEDWLGDSVEIILIASFGTEGAFEAHHDEGNTLNIQLVGSKNWTFFGDPVPVGAPMLMDVQPEPQRHLTVAPGDLLFVPSGQRHLCHADGFSVHVVILPNAASGSVLRKRLEVALAKSIELKTPVPAILGPDNDSKMADEFRSHLHDLVDQLDIEAIFAQERKHLRIRPRVKLLPKKA
jgi:hypothetical protein